MPPLPDEHRNPQHQQHQAVKHRLGAASVQREHREHERHQLYGSRAWDPPPAGRLLRDKPGRQRAEGVGDDRSHRAKPDDQFVEGRKTG